jgi:transcriptional repressor NrdR
MRCPFCDAEETKVIDSRLASNGYVVRRRRECLSCSERYTTYEHAELIMPQVIKHDGRREPFNEEKLKAGFERALEKRPVSVELIDASINRIKKRLRAMGDREVDARAIGELAMDELKSLDQVAYVRYASVYRSFQDVHAFREEIERLEKQPSPELKKVQMPLLGDDE